MTEQQIKRFVSKRLLVVLVISLAVFAIVDYFGLFHTDPFEGLQGEALANRIQLLFALMFLPLIPLGLYVIHFGYRVLKSGIFPPPGSHAIRPVRVQTDRAARSRGWVIILTGVCLCGLAIYGALIFPNELAQLLTG